MGQVITSPVQLFDIVPTVLELAGIESTTGGDPEIQAKRAVRAAKKKNDAMEIARALGM